jgi:hypothetical protein
MRPSGSDPDITTRHLVALEIISEALPLTADDGPRPVHGCGHPALHSIDAVGILKAALHVDCQLVRATLEEAIVLTAADSGGEDVVLHGFSQEMDRLGRPLIITFGGRRRALPILRYRALARAVPLHILRAVAGPGAYFARYNTDWHLDLEDVLAGQGALAPLSMDDLCPAMGLSFLEGADLAPTSTGLTARLAAIYAIYLRYMYLVGCMQHSSMAKALGELEAYLSATANEQRPQTKNSPTSDTARPQRTPIASS